MRTLLKLSDFSITVDDISLNKEDQIIIDWCDFEIKKPGIYTLQGSNRSGKSLLVKTILGAHTHNVKLKETDLVFFDKKIKIKSVRDAYKHGIVAVFQDDELISTMTLQEQLLLRHLKVSKINILYNLYARIIAFIYQKIPTTWLSDDSTQYIEKLKVYISPRNELSYPQKEIINSAKELLLKYGYNDDLLLKYPNQISGGSKAIFKIVNTQLTKNIKLLFLDEALNAVDKDKWEVTIDLVKEWAILNNVTIVAVSHNVKEIYRWQPNARFQIKDKKITLLGRGDYDDLELSLEYQEDFFIKYNSLKNSEDYIKSISTPVIVFFDKKLESNETYKKLIHFLSTHNLVKIPLDITENNKTIDGYTRLINRLINEGIKNHGSIIIVGGGALINFITFLAGTLFRGTIPLILIPTTVMAVADVVVGSKASINIGNQKHYIGCYKNPSVIIQDYQFFATLSTFQKKEGLIECLKHGLLQDKSLMTKCVTLLEKDIILDQDAFSVAYQTQKHKSKTLQIDSLEFNYAQILLYGHLHAHSLERYFNYTFSHGFAVLVGIFLNLIIEKNEDTLSILKPLLTVSDINSYYKSFFHKRIDFEKLNRIYNTDIKVQNFNENEFSILSSISESNRFIRDVKLNFIKANWDEIKESYSEFEKYLHI